MLTYSRPWRLAGKSQQHLLVSGDDFGALHVWQAIETTDPDQKEEDDDEDVRRVSGSGVVGW